MGDAPRLLELFSGEQGAAEGYRRAGFVVDCVDNRDHPAAPGPTIVADAFEYLAAHWQEYDAVTGGPECRDHTDLAYRVGKRGTGWQLAAMLEACRKLPIPWVIENVDSADMPYDLILCGECYADHCWRCEGDCACLHPPLDEPEESAQ